MRRIVSVALPWWPIESRPSSPRTGPAQVDSGPNTCADDDRPFVLVESGPRGVRITAVNRAAGQLQIASGDALADARAAHPALATAPATPLDDRRRLQRLARWLGRYGISRNAYGFIRESGSNYPVRYYGLWVDITGVAHLYGGEEALLADIERRLSSFGITVWLGLADTFGAAHALAWHGSGACRIATRGGSAEALAPLSVDSLRLDQDCIRLLRRLGLKTVGDLAGVPRVSLERRFRSRKEGDRVLMRLDQALGLRPEPRRPLAEPLETSVEAMFADTLVSSDALLGETRELVRRICIKLADTQFGVRALRLTLYRSDGSFAEATIGTSQPVHDATHLMRLLSERIAGIDLGFGVDLLRLEATRAEPVPPSQSTLAGPSPGTVEAQAEGWLTDRLANRLGNARVVRRMPRSSHWPERADVRLPALHTIRNRRESRSTKGRSDNTAYSSSRWRPPGGASRPAFLLSTPEHIDVLAEVPEGAPVRFTWRRATHRIVHAAGPERIEPEWWREVGSPVGSRVRDYYRIEDTAGARFWVFRAGRYCGEADDIHQAPAWFVHGIFA